MVGTTETHAVMGVIRSRLVLELFLPSHPSQFLPSHYVTPACDAP